MQPGAAAVAFFFSIYFGALNIECVKFSSVRYN